MYATMTILIFAKAYRNVFSNYLHTATAFNIHHYLKTVRTYKTTYTGKLYIQHERRH